MSAIYNRFAGQSLDRLAALSDGLFAIAMTLLVLDLGVPAGKAINGDPALGALVALAPRLIPYVMSFLTLGIFWVGQQTQLSHVARSDRNFAWLHLGFLLAVSLMPFSTGFLAEYLSEWRTAIVVYWFNILLLGVGLYASWRYALHAKLVNDSVTDEVKTAVERRIIVAQALYAFGALLCILPYPYGADFSIAFIMLVQLNYVIAPRIRPLYWL